MKRHLRFSPRSFNGGRNLPSLSLVLIILILILTSAHLGHTEVEVKESQPYLADRHKIAGVDCSGCHRESPPKQKAGSEVCVECHGDYAKVAERTARLDINPHDSHMGEIDCDQCHRGHQRSVLVCRQCHKFSMKVP